MTAENSSEEIEAMLATTRSSEEIAALEVELREIFAEAFPAALLDPTAEMHDPEEMMRLFERWKPVAIQKAFLRHAGRIGLVVSTAPRPK